MNLRIQTGLSEKYFRVGVVGYSSQQFSVGLARQLLSDALATISSGTSRPLLIVSGLTYLGVPKVAYDWAKAAGYKTAGIACHKASEFECFPVTYKIVTGEAWGDESATFLSNIDTLIRLGGGKQSLEETAQAKRRGIPVIEHDL